MSSTHAARTAHPSATTVMPCCPAMPLSTALTTSLPAMPGCRMLARLDASCRR